MSDPVRPDRPRSRGLLGSWLFTIVWLGVCAMAGVRMFASDADWVGRVMLAVFTALGVGMLIRTLRQTRLAARHEGAELLSDPPRPQAGQSVRVRLRSRRAVAGPVTLRLAEYRIDDNDSSTRTRLVWEQRSQASIGAGQEAITLQALFHLPVDAAASESRRDGERVNWRVEWLDAGGEPELSFDLAVRAGPGNAPAPVDRWAPRAVELATSGPTTTLVAAVTPAPPEVAALLEDAAGIEWRFGRGAWRIAAACAGVVALVMLSRAWHLATQQHDAGAALGHWAIGALLAAAALHAGTLHWRLRVDDDGARVDRGSWLWPRQQTLPRAALAGLEIELAFTVSSSGRTVEYHRVQAALGADNKCPLTPGLATREAAERLARRLAQAVADRGPRFAPGQSRCAAARGPAPLAPVLLAWLGWATLVGCAALAILG